MQLTYRGARYAVRHQAVKTVEIDLTSTFKGAAYPIRSDFAASSSASGFLRWYYQEVALSERHPKTVE